MFNCRQGYSSQITRALCDICWQSCCVEGKISTLDILKFLKKKKYFKVDVDELEDLAMKYNVSSMPTFLFIKHKNQIDSFSGANAEKLEKYIIQHSS